MCVEKTAGQDAAFFLSVHLVCLYSCCVLRRNLRHKVTRFCELFLKDTVHPILKLQSSPADDPFPNNVGVLLWFGLLFLASLYCAFLEANRDV